MRRGTSGRPARGRRRARLQAALENLGALPNDENIDGADNNGARNDVADNGGEHNDFAGTGSARAESVVGDDENGDEPLGLHGGSVGLPVGAGDDGSRDPPRLNSNGILRPSAERSVRDRRLSVTSAPGGFMAFGAHNNSERDLEARKRKLDLEIEEGRLKLRLIEAERQRLNLHTSQTDSVSTSQDPQTGIIAGTGAGVADVSDERLLNKMVSVVSEAIKESQASGISTNLVNRLVSQKESFTFSGNSLEWLRFKRAFEQSTELGGYSDRENVIRLYNCLRGEARDSVESLMLTCESAEQIMKALELRYGNKVYAIRKLLNNLRDLPRLRTGEIDLIAFSSEVRNNVVALDTLGNNYLFNPDLIADILSKIPESMVYRYNEFATRDRLTEPSLRTLAEFLSHQAEIANQAGTTFILNSQRNRRREHRSDKPTNSRRVNSIKRNTRSRSPIRKQKLSCMFCSFSNHEIRSCHKFQKLDIPGRWKWVRREKLCFNCLKSGHFGRQCREPSCKVSNCRAYHHSLLHTDNEERANQQTPKRPETRSANFSSNI